MKILLILTTVIAFVLGVFQLTLCIEHKYYRESLAWGYMVLRIAIDLYYNIQNAKLDKERAELLKTLL